MDNVKNIQELIRHSEVDALLLTSPVNRRYVFGFPSSAGTGIVTPDRAWFFVDSRYIEAAKASMPDAEVVLADAGHTYAALINDVCAELNVSRLGFEGDTLTYAEYAKFAENLNAELVPSEELINGARAVKSRAELQKMIAAQQIAEAAFTAVLPKISTKITERELANELLCAMLRAGADDRSFDPIVISGARSSMPHGVPCDEKISPGFLTIDFGAKKDGWCSDTTRTLSVGRATEEMKKVYNTVLEAQLAGIAAIRAGVLGCDVHGAAADVISAAGYGEYFGHGFGHGLGLEVHETPAAAPAYKKPLPAGAVISAEPGIYLPGRFGVRIEDVVYVTETGCENITRLPKELVEL
ncbi:MAG: aminopeptidase P family protein [Clostridiales bacterium]|nr:aminopeptidase P family protein [Clostridiales bacterium]